MSCSSCGTSKDGKPGGCRGNGTCGTGSCNKLNVYNWLNDMTLPAGQTPFEVVEVRFKGSRKEFFKNKEHIDLKVGEVVAVEASPGHDVGVISMTGELVRFQLKKKGMTEASEAIRTLYRKAKQSEVEKWNEVRDKEQVTLNRTREIIMSLKLSMKLSDVEYQGDGKKATFFYTADERVDFRELIRKLADEFRIRVEMRQIGMRQEAGRLGGLGVCGRELCCSTWLTDFKTVSTATARYQNLALNPAKLAGQCGKLKCCLNYELDSYLDALKDLPATNVPLQTEKGRAFHRKTDIFKRLMWFAVESGERKEGGESHEGPDAGNWIPIHVNRVKEILELNKQNIKVPELVGELLEEEEEEVEPDYTNVVGQDRIDRMDVKKKKKKKKKKKPSGEQTNPNAAQQNAPRPQGQNSPQGTKPQQNQGGGQPRPQQNPRPQQQGPRPQQGNRPQGQPRPQQQGQQQRPPQQQGQSPQQQGQQQRPPQQQGQSPQQPNQPQQTPRPQQGKPQQGQQQRPQRQSPQQPPNNPSPEKQ